jgi:hypothetical protein
MKYVLELYGSVSFNRNEQRDRVKVADKIKKHINNKNVFGPLLIFPEGTCVNNESTVLFHKGAFELNCTICPVGIKYNKRLSDPYWNTREQTFTQHAIYLMSRWMMVVDVWWLPPVDRLPDETAIVFADRVKAAISTAAGLKNRSWNGYLKNVMRKLDRDRMHSSSQTTYAGYVKKVNKSSESVNGIVPPSSPSPSPSSPLTLPRSSSPSESGTSEDFPSSKPISILTDRRRRHSVPTIPTQPTSYSFPNWLNESAVIDAKNRLLNESLSAATAKLSSLKETVLEKHYRHAETAAAAASADDERE